MRLPSPSRLRPLSAAILKPLASQLLAAVAACLLSGCQSTAPVTESPVAQVPQMETESPSPATVVPPANPTPAQDLTVSAEPAANGAAAPAPLAASAIVPGENLTPPMVLGSRQVYTPKSFFTYYEDWDEKKLKMALDYDCIILHPGDPEDDEPNLTAAMVRRLQAGRDGKRGTADDIKVIAYITVGEEDVAKPERGTGPDFRGPVRWSEKDGMTYTDKGYANRYLDTDENGKPDRNDYWESWFVNPNDPVWRKTVLTRLAAIDAKLKPDGFILDTIDTASPWDKRGWLQAGMLEFVEQIHAAHPDRLLFVNRGIFLLDFDGKRYRKAIDGLMFENFHTEWDDKHAVGIRSKWLDGNIEELHRLVGPNAAAPDGFHIYVQDYMARDQWDYALNVAAMRELLRGTWSTVSVSTIQLNEMFPPPGAGMSNTLPKLLKASVRLDGKRYEVSVTVAGIGDWPVESPQLIDCLIHREKDAPLVKGTRLKLALSSRQTDAAGNTVLTYYSDTVKKPAPMATIRLISADTYRFTNWSTLKVQ